MPDHRRRRAAAWAAGKTSPAAILLLGLLAASAATPTAAQPIPTFPKRPAPLTYKRPNTSAISVLYNGWPAVPITPSIFVFSLNDLLPLNKSNKCTVQVGWGRSTCARSGPRRLHARPAG
jgi:hypothetical protein